MFRFSRFKAAKQPKKARQARRQSRVRPQVLQLEDRLAPAVFTVTTTADIAGPPTPGELSLRQAIDAVNRSADLNNTIALGSGNYDITIANSAGNETANASGDFNIKPAAALNLLIIGQGPGATVVNGQGLDRVFQITGNNSGVNVTFQDLEISGGATSANGGAVYLNDTGDTAGVNSVTLNDVMATGNRADGQGGAIFTDTGNITLSGSIVSGNAASDSGGGLYTNNGNISLFGSSVSGNTAGDEGGGIYETGTTASATVTIRNSHVDNNVSNSDSGGLADFATGALTIDSSSISGNSNDASAGGAMEIDSQAVSITNSVLNNNHAGADGGAIDDDSSGGTMLISGSILDGNAANGDGGALYNDGAASVTIVGSQLDGNSAYTDGGAIEDLTGTNLNILNSAISGNRAGAGGAGGALYNAAASLTIDNSTIADNLAAGESGGGVEDLSTTLTISGSIISGNISSHSDGGGIQTSAATATVIGSAFNNDSAGDNGGGFDFSGTTLSVTNSSFSGDQAVDDGGGLSSSTGSSVSLTNCTPTNDVAVEAGGDNDDSSFQPGSIGGTVFQDSNGNGTWDAGEPGLAGVTVQLLGAGGAVVQQATTAADGSYSFTGLAAGNYSVSQVVPAGWTQTAGPASYSVTVASGTASTGDNFGDFLNPTTTSSPSNLILLPSSTLQQLQQEALANTPQWQAFKANLDQNLNVVTSGGYEGAELGSVANYALGYQVLQNIDPVTAAEYADKAIAVLKSGLNDYQKGATTTQQYLAQGDGTTTTFTLPNSDIVPSTVAVYVAPVTSTAVVHGATNGQDPVGYYLHYISVSNTPGGPATYQQGVSWDRSPNYADNVIDWSPSGPEPAVGSTYYVNSASAMDATAAAFTLNGNTITLATAPTANQAIFVQYLYGTHTANGGLAYQQTSAGDGGFDSILVDDNYTARYLQYLALGLNWLQGYAGLSPALEQQAASQLTTWSNYLQANGYHVNCPPSNYGAGEYAFQVMAALAVDGVNPTAGSQLLSQVLSNRQTYFVPQLTNPTNSMAGGFYPDGWNYGALASENILLAGLALEEAGQIPSDSAESQWASQMVEQLVSDQSTPATIYDGGDGYAFPRPFPGPDLISVLSATASSPVDQAYANYMLQNYSFQHSSDFIDLLYHNPSAPAAFWSSLGLQDFATGTGLLTARSDWGSNPTWMAVQMGNLANGSDHQAAAPGGMEISQGADQLLINGASPGGLQGYTKSQYSNTLVVNDNGAGTQNYPYSMGAWYGTPGVVINAYEATNNYVYLDGNYAAAYSNNQNPGGGGPVSYLTRQVVYLRPDYIVVYDNATSLLPTTTKELRWNFLNPPSVSGDSWVESVGSSKLFGQSYSTVPLTTTATSKNVYGATIQEVITQNAEPTSSVQYVTAFQVAPSSTGSMVATQHIVSTDGRMEGVQMGNQVVLFGKGGNVDLSTAVTYQVSGSGAIQQLLVNLQPGQAYQVTADGGAVQLVTASAQGTLSFTTAAGGTQTIQVVKVP